MSNPPAPRRTTVAELKAKLGDVRIDESPEREEKTVTLIDRPISAKYANNLTPPADASYWRTQSFTPMNAQKLTFDSSNQPYSVETLTWRIDAHIYVVNARPDSDFANNGGAVYVVLVHGGSAATGATVGGGMQYRYTVSLRSSGSAIKQLPPSNSGLHSGDDWNYPISFSQDMQMFRNDGNDTFTFQADYEDSVDVYKGQQTGFVNSASSVQWGIVLDNYPDFYTNFPFAALSVFEFKSLDQVTFDCNASVYSQAGSDGFPMASETRSITVNCQFSA